MITIKDVAQKADVSIGTVDRVVHRRGRVSKETTDKVLRVIKESGYKPNIFARRLSMSKVFNFAVLMPKPFQDSRYWEMTVKGMEKAQNELKPYHVKLKYMFYDRYSENSFKRAGSKVLDSEADGILIAPVLYQAIKEFLQRIPDNIPYVFFDANIPGEKALSFIGQDSFQSGVICGKLMKLMVGKKGIIAVILAFHDDYRIMKRAEGFKFYFENETGIRLVTYELSNHSDKDTFFKLMDDIFAENKDLKGIFVTNVSVHNAGEYLKNKISNRKIHLIGYDLVRDNIEYLNEGIIDFIISQKAETQGYEGIYTLYRSIVLQEPCEKSIMMPLEIITKENFIYYNGY